MSVAILRDKAPTSTTSKDFTTPAIGGAVPKGVIIICSVADTDNVVESDLAYSIGFSTGADDQFSITNSENDAVTTTECDRRSNASTVVNMIVDATPQVLASVNQFITNGVRLDFSSVDTDAVFLTFIFFYGADVQCHTGLISLGTGTSPIDVTSPGFLPSVVFFIEEGDAFPVTSTDHELSFGIAVNGANRGILSYTNDGDTTSVRRSRMMNDAVAGQMAGSGVTYQVSAGDFDSSGFSVTPSANAGNDQLAYLAVDLGGLDVSLRSVDSPTTATSISTTGVGFKPQFIMKILSDLTSENSDAIDNAAAAFGFSIFTNEEEISNAFVSRDNVSTMVCQSISDDQAINFLTDTGSAVETQHAAIFESMDADGYTLNYSIADDTARKWFDLAIEEGVVAQLARPTSDVAAGGWVGVP